jgi:hypothetical protein
MSLLEVMTARYSTRILLMISLSLFPMLTTNGRDMFRGEIVIASVDQKMIALIFVDVD